MTNHRTRADRALVAKLSDTRERFYALAERARTESVRPVDHAGAVVECVEPSEVPRG